MQDGDANNVGPPASTPSSPPSVNNNLINNEVVDNVFLFNDISQTKYDSNVNLMNEIVKENSDREAMKDEATEELVENAVMKAADEVKPILIKSPQTPVLSY